MNFAQLFMLLKLGYFEDFMTHQGHPWGWADTLVLTFAGFFIVFLVLLLLIIIFTVFGKVMEKANKKQEAKATESAKPVQAQSGEVDEETAAVITAAITEASGGKNVIIKEIKEAGN